MNPPRSGPHKTKIMVAGEFNSGKSKLINGLIGRNLLPSQAVSTSLPPIWISYGNAPSFRIDRHENCFTIGGLESLNRDENKYCRLFCEHPFLENLELIEVADALHDRQMIEEVDMIVWCSNSVQAWRQSEISAWDQIPKNIADKSVLLLTHADRLESDHDRLQVLHQVRRKAKGLFRDIQMLSLKSSFQISEFATELLDYISTPCSMPSNETVFQAPAPIRLVGPTSEQAVTNIFAAERPFRAHQPNSEIRSAWNRITRRLDLSQPSVLKAAIEELFLEMDENTNVTDFPLIRANQR